MKHSSYISTAETYNVSILPIQSLVLNIDTNINRFLQNKVKANKQTNKQIISFVS